MIKHFLLLVAITVSSINYAQEIHFGEIITDYEDTYMVKASGFKIGIIAQYKSVLDTGGCFIDPLKQNPLIETGLHETTYCV